MYHIFCCLNSPDHILRLGTQEIPQCTFGHQTGEELCILLFNGFADCGSADSFSAGGFPRYDYAFNPGVRKLFFHNLVIDSCYLACGLLPHIAAGDSQASAILLNTARSSRA